MKEELLEFEKKLLELRMEMAELLKKVDNETDASNRAKLRQLEEELGYVIRQYRMLESQLNLKINAGQQQVQPQPMQPVQIPIQAVQPVNQPQPVYVQQNVQMKKKNMENAIGTSLMGILASGLIFISIILFATLGLPYLSDALKMLACYVVSIVIIVVSMYKLNKHPNSKFYLSLSACGVGALYISLLLTNIYFEYINDITLFVCITIWVFFMCFLSKIKSTLFAVIGHIGIMIAVIFGVILCVNQNDMVKFAMLTVFFAVSTGTLYGIHFDRRIEKNILENVFALISLNALITGAFDIIDVLYHPYYLCIMLMIVAFMAALIYCDWSGSRFSYGAMLTAYAISFMMTAGAFFEYDEHMGVIAYILSMALVVISEFKAKWDETGKYFLNVVMIIYAWVGLTMLEDVFEYLMLPLLAAPYLALGVWKKNSLCKYVSMFVVFIFFVSDIDMIHKFILSLLSMITLYVIAFVKKESWSYKVILHLLSIVFILSSVSDIIHEVIVDFDTGDALIYIIIALFNLIMFRIAKVREEFTTIYNIVNVIMMAVGMGFVAACTPLHIFVILVVIGVFMVNSKNYLDKGNIIPGIYVGIKFTILLLVILGSFDTENYIVSIMLILLAIMSIVIGFVFEYKALRVYGLALAMISIFKLVMVDIHYDNTLGNALSFFVSGVLCFAISMIYNYIGKKLER